MYVWSPLKQSTLYTTLGVFKRVILSFIFFKHSLARLFLVFSDILLLTSLKILIGLCYLQEYNRNTIFLPLSTNLFLFPQMLL